MKATINGITVEGTPHEIAEYQQMMEVKATIKPTSLTVDTAWLKQQTTITNGDVGCPNKGGLCYCTGACNGSTLSKMTESFNRLHEYTQKAENSRV